MSRRHRRILAVTALCAFAVLVPSLVLYASGYRFSTEDGQSTIVPTGALYVGLPTFADMTVFIDGAAHDSPGIFSSTLLIRSVHPGFHQIDVVASGTAPWHKDAFVLPGRVSYSFPFMAPETIPLIPVVSDDTSSTTAHVVSDARILELIQLAASSTEGVLATSSVSAVTQGDTALWLDDGHTIVVEWRGHPSESPYFFCSVIDGGEVCFEQIFMPIGTEVSQVAFFPGRDDVILFATAQGIFALEIDRRSDMAAIPLYRGHHEGVAISAGEIYVVSHGTLYYIDMQMK